MGNLYALIGHPIGHSMSPAMHNDEFNQLGMSHHYQAFDVHPDNLENAIVAFRSLGISGFNVTIPHKQNVMPLLDEIDPIAKKIGAVNTVHNVDGKLIGYNTDGLGYILSLKQALQAGEFTGEDVLIIGSGGGARALYVTLLNEKVGKIDLANRTVEKAQALIQDNGQEEHSTALSLQSAEEVLGNYDIVINTTSVGMSPHTDEIPLSLENMKSNVVLSDIVYNPLKTKWLSIGESKGAIVHSGIGMLVGQGALAFQMWTGQQPNLNRMEQVVLTKLGG